MPLESSICTGSPSSDKCTSSVKNIDFEAWTAAGLVGLAVFPVLGSVLALWTGLPRRFLQLGLLGLFLLVSIGGLSCLNSHVALASRRIGGRVLLIALVSVSLIATLVVSAIIQGARPASSYAWISAAMTVLWLALVGSNAFLRSTSNWVVEGSKRVSPGVQFNWFVCLLVCGIALTAYAKGPEPGEALMAFGGSYIQAGTDAAILLALALVALRGWYALIVLISSLYLVLISTSRTGLLIFLVLCSSIFVSRATDSRSPNRATRGRKVGQDVLFLILSGIVVAAPLVLGVDYYPYKSSVGVEREHVVQELIHRYATRVVRLLPGEPTQDAARGADARWRILFDSAAVVITRPEGHWPREFQSIVRTSCGPETCKYPHNLLLEIGFDFGWLPFILVGFGVFYWAIGVLWSLPLSPLHVRVAGIGFLGHLVFAQVSGNLLDHSVALLIGTLWTMSRVLPSRTRGW